MLIAYVKKLFSFTGGPNGNIELINTITTHLFWLILAIVLCMPVYGKVKEYIDKRKTSVTVFDAVTLGFNVVLLLLCVAQLVGKSYNPFIYFRF